MEIYYTGRYLRDYFASRKLRENMNVNVRPRNSSSPRSLVAEQELKISMAMIVSSTQYFHELFHLDPQPKTPTHFKER